MNRVEIVFKSGERWYVPGDFAAIHKAVVDQFGKPYSPCAFAVWDNLILNLAEVAAVRPYKSGDFGPEPDLG